MKKETFLFLPLTNRRFCTMIEKSETHFLQNCNGSNTRCKNGHRALADIIEGNRPRQSACGGG